MKEKPKLTISMPKKLGNTAVKMPKAKKMPGALEKPSKFYKAEDVSEIKKPSIKKLQEFLANVKSRQSK